MGQVGIAVAFGAGMISFLSPCVLPVIPAYVSFMTGMSLSEIKGGERQWWRILGPVLMFVAGFCVVFVAMGAGASAIGSLLAANRRLLTQIAGGVVVLMGLAMIGVIPSPWARWGAGVDAASLRKFGPWAALALGLVFPFALGPCAGPVYGAILTLAVDSHSVRSGALLLLVYSAGLALPFVVVSLLMSRLTGMLRWFAKHSRLINRIAGVVLVLMGLAMVTGLIDQVTAVFQTLPVIGTIG